MDTIEKTWTFVNKTRSKEDWINSIDDWSKLESLRIEHKDCLIKIHCYCSTHSCNHLSDYVSSTRGCCVWCDEMVQPMLANPRNKKHVLKYCKLGSTILYPDVETTAT